MPESNAIRAIRVYLCPTGHGRNLLFAAVETRAGIVGVGEGSQSNQDDAVVANIRQLAKEYIGSSILDSVERMGVRLTSARAGRAMFIATSALEIALWDAIGKTLDVPVCQLLGGRCRDYLECYTTIAAGVTDWRPGALAVHAKASVDDGYCGVKILPFVDVVKGAWTAQSMARSLSRVEAVRESIGPDRRLMIESNFTLNFAETVRMCERLAQQDCYWIEAPLLWDDPRELARLRSRISQRVASGEQIHGRYAYREMIELQAVDVLQPDVKWTGGLLEAKKISAWAEAYQMVVAPHNNSGPVATAASAHLAITLPNAGMLESAAIRPAWEQELVAGSALIENGKVYADTLAASPGLGVRFDESVAKRVATSTEGCYLVIDDR